MSFPKVTGIPGSASSEVAGLSWPSGRHSKRQQEGDSPGQPGRAGEQSMGTWRGAGGCIQQDSGLSTGKGKGIEQVIFQANLY